MMREPVSEPTPAVASLLLVDPAAVHTAAMAEVVQEAGHRLTIAADSQDALTLLRAQVFDLVLLGIEPAAPASLRLLQQVKGSSALRHLPVLVLASTAARAQVESLIEEALLAGADDFLFLPSSTRLLQARLTLCLRRSRSASARPGSTNLKLLQRYERDLQIGREIQASFLPLELPQPPGWEVTARFQPARQVAGDFYDAFLLTQKRRLGFVIADVCDKGIGAALFMALFRSLLRAFASQNYSPRWTDILGEAPAQRRMRHGQQQTLTTIGANALKNAVTMTNAYMVENHPSARMYATLFFGVLDPATGMLIYVNGGHNPPVLIGPNGIRAQLEPTGPVVGIFPGGEFGIQQVQLLPGDVLFCYTDGIPDAKDATGAFFTEERLLELAAQPAPSAAALLDRIDTHVGDHIASAPRFDDITMLAVRRAATAQAGAAAELLTGFGAD